jgi:hypothetical protein
MFRMKLLPPSSGLRVSTVERPVPNASLIALIHISHNVFPAEFTTLP